MTQHYIQNYWLSGLCASTHIPNRMQCLGNLSSSNSAEFVRQIQYLNHWTKNMYSRRVHISIPDAPLDWTFMKPNMLPPECTYTFCILTINSNHFPKQCSPRYSVFSVQWNELFKYYLHKVQSSRVYRKCIHIHRDETLPDKQWLTHFYKD
jgi:hypothetical protein